MKPESIKTRRIKNGVVALIANETGQLFWRWRTPKITTIDFDYLVFDSLDEIEAYADTGEIVE